MSIMSLKCFNVSFGTFQSEDDDMIDIYIYIYIQNCQMQLKNK